MYELKSKLLVPLAICSIAPFASCKAQKKEEAKKPNVVFFFVDDLGYKDIAVYGSDYYKTPNVDKLAEKGVMFTNGYAACTVCSPTRASVMSGKYPAKIHCTDWIEGWKLPHAKLRVPEWTMYMDTAEYTLAEAFRDAGYVTGHFGKWHLGEQEMYWPTHNGFMVNKGGWKKGSPNRNKKEGYNGYFTPYGNPNLTDGPEGEYLTERLANEACGFISENKEKPFFLNFWFYNVHTPLMAKEDKIEQFTEIVDSTKYQKNPVYAAMVSHMDDAVGKVMQKLKDEGLLENTIIIFSSDNGGLIGNNKRKVTNNYPLREGKGNIYEGGVRVPNIMIAPGVSQKNVKCDVPMISMDFYPTLLDLAHIHVSEKVKEGLDGVSLVPLLTGKGTIHRDALYWHYPHYHLEGGRPYSAIRKGDYKLLNIIEDNKYELYNITEDIGETKDLSAEMPEKVEELKADLEAWKKKVGAQMPTENPDYDPKRAWKVK